MLPIPLDLFTQSRARLPRFFVVQYPEIYSVDLTLHLNSFLSQRERS